MKFIDLYPGSMTDFTHQFVDNEALFNQAVAFWRGLEGIAGLIFLFAIAMGVFFAVFYYTAWNELPGRHYRPLHWAIWLVVTFIATFLLTWGFEYWQYKPRLEGANAVEIKIALMNGVYALLTYLTVSFVWCNLKALPTNAYRLLKL